MQKDKSIMMDDIQAERNSSSFSFPAYRSEDWLEQNRLMPAVEECLSGITIQPKSLMQYSHIRAYEAKAANVRRELRNALFRQALFKIQNIEVASLRKCKQPRILREIRKVDGTSYISNFLTGKETLSKEIWLVDRCGYSQYYKVVYYSEGGDGFYCKVYPRSMENFVNYLRYYMSL